MKPRILIVQNEYDNRAAALSLLFLEILTDLADTSMWDAPTEAVPADLASYDGIIIGGSEASANDDVDWVVAEMELVERLIEREIPLLGICFGHQLVARALGAEVVRNDEWNKGFQPIAITKQDPIWVGLDDGFLAPVWHSEEVRHLPAELETIGRSPTVTCMAFRLRRKPVWGIQFHPEITPSVCRFGRALPRTWRDPANFAQVHASRVVANFATLLGTRPSNREVLAV